MGLIDRIRGALRGRRPEPDGATQGPAGPRREERPARQEGSGTAPGEAPATAPTGPSAPASGRHPTTTVQPGETLADVAARHGVDADDIARLNGIEEPDLIFAGQVFKLPRG